MKTGPFFDSVLKFSKCFKKAIFSNYFFLFNGTFSAAESFPRESSYPNSKLNASTMGGQRTGLLKDRSELETSFKDIFSPRHTEF